MDWVIGVVNVINSLEPSANMLTGLKYLFLITLTILGILVEWNV